jgi:hypothetical protein
MNYKLVKLPKYSGEEASIYSIFLFEAKKTLFDLFIEENKNLFKSELKDLSYRLIVIGHDTGARNIYFKEHEGKPGDGVCALYDEPESNLRLYCIRYGSSLVILGGGGPKVKSISAFQDDKKLTDENYLLRDIAKEINQRIKDREIEFTNNHKDFKGSLEFYEDQE